MIPVSAFLRAFEGAVAGSPGGFPPAVSTHRPAPPVTSLTQQFFAEGDRQQDAVLGACRELTDAIYAVATVKIVVSMAWFAVSTPNDRCRPSNPEKVKMIHNTPGARSVAVTAVGSQA